MDSQLLLKLTNDCKVALSKGSFEEAETIFEILNFIYGDSGISEYYSLVDLLRCFESWVHEAYINQKSKQFVYFIKDLKTKNIKIGCTTNIEKRIKQLNTRYETKFAVLGLLAVEKMYDAEHFFHIAFKKYNVKNEFFNIPDSILTPVISMIAEGKSYSHIKNVIEQNFII